MDADAFGRVFSEAKRSKDKQFTVLYRNNGSNTARLGMAISKKNCRLAAQRNRLKRLVRESFRLHQDGLAGIDIVVLNQRHTHEAENRTLFTSLDKHWDRCGNDNTAAAKRDEG